MVAWKSVLGGMLLLLGGVAVAEGQTPLAPTLAPHRPTRVVGAPAPLPSRSATPMATPTLAKQDVDTWLDGYMPYALHQADIPGAVVVVVKDGQILTARGFGYADVAKRTPVDPDRTLFRPGSVSKLVTWTAVMQLVEQGKLNLDQDVNAYLDFRIPPRDGKPITLRQIMTHTAGFEEAAKDILFYDPHHMMPLGTYLKRWVPERIFAPGTTPAYSNWATALAGYIVQRVSGQPFDSYIEQHVFAPLGMQNSTFRQPLPARLAGQLSTGYPRLGQAEPFELLGPTPAGALSASGTDMGRFMIAHLQGGALGGNRILTPATAETMHNSPLGPVNPMSLMPPLNRMELGFFETNINGHEVIGHLGDTEAFHTSLHLFIRDGVGFYVSFNSPGRQGAVQPLRVALFQDFADRYFPDSAPPAPPGVDAKTAADHARMMAGTWQVSRRSNSNFLSLIALIGQTKVSVGPKGDLVIPSLVGLNGRPRQWVEIAPFLWRDAFGHDRLAAKVVDGRVVRWSMDFFSPFEVYDRPPLAKSSAWILPAMYVSIAILLLTLLYWPGGWYVRRRYGAQPSVSGRALKVYRATRIMAGLDVLLLGGWALAISQMLTNLRDATDAFDPWLWALQTAGLIIFIGAVPITGYNMVLSWTDDRRWTRKLWNTLVFLATLMLLYFAAQFGLIAMTVHY